VALEHDPGQRAGLDDEVDELRKIGYDNDLCLSQELPDRGRLETEQDTREPRDLLGPDAVVFEKEGARRYSKFLESFQLGRERRLDTAEAAESVDEQDRKIRALLSEGVQTRGDSANPRLRSIGQTGLLAR
jgi:hypothetical protein